MFVPVPSSVLQIQHWTLCRILRSTDRPSHSAWQHYSQGKLLTKIIHATCMLLFSIQIVLKCPMLQMLPFLLFLFFFFFFCLERNSTTKTYKFSFHLQSLFSILVTPSMQIYTFILSVHRVSVLLEENGSKELPQFFFSISLSSVVLIAAALLLRKNNFQFRNGVYLSLALFALYMIPT